AGAEGGGASGKHPPVRGGRRPGRLHHLFGLLAGDGADDRTPRDGHGRPLCRSLGRPGRRRPVPGTSYRPKGFCMTREVKTLFVAEAEDGIRLDRWFKRRWPHLSHIQVQKMARSGQIRVDGSRVKPEDRLTAGAAVRVPPIPDPVERVPGEKPKISDRDAAYAKSLVLYEDDMVIALNKPHGLAVQGGTKTTKHVDRLLSAWGEGMERPRLVHRLDRDTSGVLLLGKGPEAAKRLAGAFARRQPKKPSWAIVIGKPKPSAGQIDLALKKSGINDFEIMRPADPKEHGAEPAETAYATVSRAAHRAAWMALRPFTGRTH